MASRCVNRTRALACSSGSNTNGVVATIMSALPSSSTAFMVGNGASITV
jgi:hypothetical protein